ncbi:MAG: hypothetical protein QOF06_2191 [Solirubrobacterales bacterium]|jgi:hypothetical protein|nr:hypothetical protein [Solirubrobacterales bacterium]
MRRTSQVAALAAAIAAAAASAVTADGPGETVKVKSTVTIGATGYLAGG